MIIQHTRDKRFFMWKTPILTMEIKKKNKKKPRGLRSKI